MITNPPINASCLKDYQTITIGRQMEDNHRQFVFDCSGFDEEVTSVELVHQRSEDVAPYPVTTASTDTLTWTVTDTDTAYAGDGRAELRIRFANGMAKTATFKTYVIESITGDTVIPEPLQSWYDALIEYIDDHAASQEQIEAAVEAYLEDHPIPAPVTSVNAQTGDVVLTASDVGAMPSSYTAPVTSVNTKTGAVVLDASDVGAMPDTTTAADLGAYVKPSAGIPKTDLATTVQASLDKADTALQTAPVTSVNGQTGAVALNASDVGAMPASYVAPVLSVNGQTGNVTLDADDVGALPDSYTAPVASVDGKTGAVTVLPTGGTTGQVLAKKTGTNYDVEWQTVSGGGAVDSVNGQTGTVVLDASDVGALPDSTTIDDVYWCTYGTTTSAEIEAALTAGKLPCVKYNDYVYTLRFRNSATNHRFICNYGGKEKTIACQSGTWIPGGDLTFLTTSYTAPVTSVNGATGAVTLSIPTVPTNVSAFTNDAGYLTQHQSLTAYQTKAITDTGGYFTTDTVEGALQEIGAEIAGINTLIGTGVIS